MALFSAGLLIFHYNSDRELEVLLVHPGGPFWSKKDLESWSIPKGEYTVGEDALITAEREFEEELGSAPPRGERINLGELRQPSGKRVVAFATEGEFDVNLVRSNTFEMEWPPKSGTVVSFPEIDRAAWMNIPLARTKLLKGQHGFLDRLADALSSRR